MSEQSKKTAHNTHTDPSQPPESKTEKEKVREISLEEFNPKGTLLIAILYFVIVTVMWIFMYFVEFAGHGPSIMD